MVKNKVGFSLIELLVVLAIVSILATLAYPSYKKHRMRVHRVDAQTHLMNIAMQLEQYKQFNQSYERASLDRLGFEITFPLEGPKDYQLTLQVTSNDWELSAAPINGSGQEGDGSLVLNQAGQQCWIAGQSCRPNASSHWHGR